MYLESIITYTFSPKQQGFFSLLKCSKNMEHLICCSFSHLVGAFNPSEKHARQNRNLRHIGVKNNPHVMVYEQIPTRVGAFNPSEKICNRQIGSFPQFPG